MARKKISEFRAKTLLYQSLGTVYSGLSFDTSMNLDSISGKLDKRKSYVVKVDQGVKKRMKKGLVVLDVPPDEMRNHIKNFQKKGYSQFLIEEYEEHESRDEHYLAIEQTRGGLKVYFSHKGGIDIEEHEESVRKFLVPYSTDDIERFQTKEFIEKMRQEIHISSRILELLLAAFELNYFSFLEINPLVVLKDKIGILDCAVEVDSAAEFFVNGAWNPGDFVEPKKEIEYEEIKNVETLAAKSQASFKLDLLNPNGSIFVLLSGGGASIVIADEIYNLGYGKELANYGEYSGNPNEEETYLYTKNLLSLLIQSKSKKKVLIVGGGVANFTDVRVTFRGIIQALDEVKDKLVKENVKVYVRRGGPYQEEGLKLMKNFLQKENLYGEVSGPEMVLTEIVRKGLAKMG